MPSADHSRQALLRQADWLASVSSPRVRTNSFPSCTFGLYIAVSVWLLGFNLFGSLTRQHMPETVSVRKVNGLPRASFSRNLAVQALPLAMCLAPPPAFRDFHPIEFAHAERTKIEQPGLPGCYILKQVAFAVIHPFRFDFLINSQGPTNYLFSPVELIIISNFINSLRLGSTFSPPFSLESWWCFPLFAG